MLTKLYAQMQAFMASREGVTAIEYAIVAVAIAGIVGLVFANDGALKSALDAGITKIAAKL